MQSARRITYFTASFVLAAGLMLAFSYQIGLFEVRGVSVEMIAPSSGARPLNVAERRLKSRLEQSVGRLQGRKVWEIDLREVQAALASDEWVRDVMVSRSLPNEIRVRISAKESPVLFINKKSEFIPVTDDGVFLSPLPKGLIPDVPLLRGEIFASDSEKRRAAVRFAIALGEQGPMSRVNISEISWTADGGYAVTLIEPKVEVRLGEDRVDLKALRVAQVLSYLSTNNLKGRVIDASFSKKVLVRVRKGP